MDAQVLINRYEYGIRDFDGADLTGANMKKANLIGAKVTLEQLSKARTLEGATMPDGTIHA